MGLSSAQRNLVARFARALIDEFQGTGLLQTEMLRRLCGEPFDGAASNDWTTFRIRPGMPFLVSARGVPAARSPSPPISSRAPMLAFVNTHFRERLSEANGQPSFTAPDPFHATPDDEPAAVALDISPEEGGRAEQLRGRNRRRWRACPSRLRRPHAHHTGWRAGW